MQPRLGAVGRVHVGPELLPGGPRLGQVGPLGEGPVARVPQAGRGVGVAIPEEQFARPDQPAAVDLLVPVFVGSRQACPGAVVHLLLGVQVSRATRPVVALDIDQVIGRLMDAYGERAVVLQVHGAKRFRPGTPMPAVDIRHEERGNHVDVTPVDADGVTDGQLLDFDDRGCGGKVHSWTLAHGLLVASADAFPTARALPGGSAHQQRRHPFRAPDHLYRSRSVLGSRHRPSGGLRQWRGRAGRRRPRRGAEDPPPRRLRGRCAVRRGLPRQPQDGP